MNNALSKNFTFWSLLKFSAPTIIMMIFLSMYTMVDGAFVSQLINSDALSAVNVVYPVQGIVIAVSIMLATGSSAIIARKMGQGLYQEAKEDFTFIVIFGLIVSIVITFTVDIFIDPILNILGTTDKLYDYCKDYLGVLTLFFPVSMLQILFQFFFITAGKPNIGLFSTIAGGFANIILDYVFISKLNLGIGGAAIATGIGYSIPAITGLIYFSFFKNNTIYFVKPKLDWQLLRESCLNGSSEMVTNLATSITTFLFNITMLKLVGEDGVAAVSIVLYAQFTLTALYLGFSEGVAPVISFNYGKKDSQTLKRIFKISMFFVGVSSIFVFLLAIRFSSFLVEIFVDPNSRTYSLAIHGFITFALSYIFTGINIFASAMFTAFGNGKVSAIISFSRTFLFIFAGINILPLYFDLTGVWLVVPLAEVLTLLISVAYMFQYKEIYEYA